MQPGPGHTTAPAPWAAHGPPKAPQEAPSPGVIRAPQLRLWLIPHITASTRRFAGSSLHLHVGCALIQTTRAAFPALHTRAPWQTVPVLL